MAARQRSRASPIARRSNPVGRALALGQLVSLGLVWLATLPVLTLAAGSGFLLSLFKGAGLQALASPRRRRGGSGA